MIPFRRFKMGKCSNFNFSQFVLFLFLFGISYRDGYRTNERTRERAAMKRRRINALCLQFLVLSRFYLFVCLFLAEASTEAEEKRNREKETTRIIIIKAWETSMRQIDR